MAGHWLQHDCHALQRGIKGINLSLPWFILVLTWGKFERLPLDFMGLVWILRTLTSVTDWTPGRILKEYS